MSDVVFPSIHPAIDDEPLCVQPQGGIDLFQTAGFPAQAKPKTRVIT